jgi:hypothetical protein
MTDEKTIIEKLKGCHTKGAWRTFLSEFGPEIATTKNAKILKPIFKALAKDAQSLNYDIDLWKAMLQGCLSSWDLALGQQIAQYVSSIPSASLAILSAEVLMQSSKPAKAREVVNRALKLSNLSPWEKLQLQMILCNTYVEQANYPITLKYLRKMEDTLRHNQFEPKNLASISYAMGRSYFFLGLYAESAFRCHIAYEIYYQNKEWDLAARCLFNTATSYYNAGLEGRTKFLPLIQQCIDLAKKHDLTRTLSHCYAFLGLTYYHQGNFGEAAKYQKLALQSQAPGEVYSQLYMSSMLALIYLRSNNYAMAEKTIKQLTSQMEQDQSQKLTPRYQAIEGQIAWQRGDFKESQRILEEATKPFFSKGIRRLEDLALMSRYYLQCAMLGFTNKDLETELDISTQVRSNMPTWLDYLSSVAQWRLTFKQYAKAEKMAREALAIAREQDSEYFQGMNLLTLIQLHLVQENLGGEFKELHAQFDAVLKRSKNSPFKIQSEFIKAAIAYRQGDLAEVIKRLQTTKRFKEATPFTRKVLDAWLASLKGYSPKLQTQEDLALLARTTWIYFHPSIKRLDDNKFVISNCYEVQVEKNSVIGHFIDYLFERPELSATIEELQQNVWQQSLNLQGWEQKIRNTIMRLRSTFCQTMAPFILQQNNQVRIFHEAINIDSEAAQKSTNEDKIIKLLSEGPLSSLELSNRLNISQATTKRLVKKLVDDAKIAPHKSGRQVIYSPNIERQGEQFDTTYSS